MADWVNVIPLTPDGAERQRDQVLDAGEGIEVEEFQLDEVAGMIKHGRIGHSLVIVASHLLEIYRREHPRDFPF